MIYCMEWSDNDIAIVFTGSIVHGMDLVGDIMHGSVACCMYCQ